MSRPSRASLAALAFTRAGLSPDGALVVSARELRRAVNVCRAHPKVAVLTSPDAGPAELARALFPQTPRAFVVCEGLGGAEERIVHVRPAEATTRPWTNPDVVLVVDDRRPPEETGWISGAVLGPSEWGLPREAFGEAAALEPEIRALVLARLGPRLGDLVWDLGSGDGSVGIECARFGAAVVAVERDKAGFERVRENVSAHGVRVAVSRGEVPSVLDHLPEPDAVFVGRAAPGTPGTSESSGTLGTPGTLAACAERALSRVVALAADVDAPALLDVLTGQGFTAGAVRLQTTPMPSASGPAVASAPVTVVWGRRGGYVARPRPARDVRRIETIPIGDLGT